jgi:hypothetical protein
MRKRGKGLRVRLTDEEHALMLKVSKACGVSASEFIRDALARAHAKMLREESQAVAA